MLARTINIICTFIFSILDFEIINKYIGANEKLNSKKNILFLSILTLEMYAFYSNNYQVQNVLNKLLIGLAINIVIFKEKNIKILVAYIIFLFNLFISDMIVVSILMPFVTKSELRTNPLIFSFSNALVYITTYIISTSKIFRKKINKIIDKISQQNEIETAIYFISLILVITNILFFLEKEYQLNEKFLTNILALVVLIFYSVMYIKSRISVSDTLSRYDTLFETINNKNEILELRELNKHEEENTLLMIKGYIENNENDKALKEINNLISINEDKNEENLKSLVNIPNGGLQKLIYFILLAAKDKKITLNIDISETVKKPFEKISYKKEHLLCRLIGIFLKNAVEAAGNSRKKILSLEIYSVKDKTIDIVISNTFRKKDLNIDKIGKRGYTSKGKGHGRGTYFAKKIVNKNKDFLKEHHEIIGKFYIEHIEIKY